MSECIFLNHAKVTQRSRDANDTVTVTLPNHKRDCKIKKINFFKYRKTPYKSNILISGVPNNACLFFLIFLNPWNFAFMTQINCADFVFLKFFLRYSERDISDQTRAKKFFARAKFFFCEIILEGYILDIYITFG